MCATIYIYDKHHKAWQSICGAFICENVKKLILTENNSMIKYVKIIIY